MNAEKIRLAEEIDSWVLDIVRRSAGEEQADERILEGMFAYMPLFKQLLDTCTGLEMKLLAQRYAGFYRFAGLLERLAQAIRDGAVSVPEEVPMPPGWAGTPAQPKKKRPVKPKPKRGPEQQQIRRPITFLPTYTELIFSELAQTEEQYATFVQARSKPHVLDDELVDRAIRLYEEQLAFIPLHERQLDWWLSEPLSDAQRYQVEDLRTKLPLLRDKTQALLDLLAELRQGTIDRILEMSDEELALKVLRGEIGRAE